MCFQFEFGYQGKYFVCTILIAEGSFYIFRQKWLFVKLIYDWTIFEFKLFSL